MVAFRMAMIPALELQRRLSEITAPEGTPLAGPRLRIRTRVVSEYQLGWMRLSPHIYNSMEEIDTVVALVRGYAR
jgi:selenocysteine lyase/cysteine desulfurase